MTGRGLVDGWVCARSAWTRTGLTVVGAGLVILAVSMTRAALTSLSRMDGHAAAHSAPGVMVAVVFVAVPLLLFGIAFAAVGLTIPGETKLPSIPDLGFSPHQRRRVVVGALLQVFGPIAGAAVAVFQGRLPLIGSRLVVLPIVAGWGLVFAGFGSRLVTSRFVPERVTNPLREVRKRSPTASNRLATIRTFLITVGLLSFAFGVGHLYGPLPELIDPIAAGLLAAWGSATAGFGTLVPSRGDGPTIPPADYSPSQAKFVGYGSAIVAVAPLLAVVFRSGGWYVIRLSVEIVYLGWLLIAVGMASRAYSRLSSRFG